MLQGFKLNVGMWRSMVAHKSGGLGAAGSNPVIPTIFVFCKICNVCKLAICDFWFYFCRLYFDEIGTEKAPVQVLFHSSFILNNNAD